MDEIDMRIESKEIIESIKNKEKYNTLSTIEERTKKLLERYVE